MSFDTSAHIVPVTIIAFVVLGAIACVIYFRFSRNVACTSSVLVALPYKENSVVPIPNNSTEQGGPPVPASGFAPFVNVASHLLTDPKHHQIPLPRYAEVPHPTNTDGPVPLYSYVETRSSSDPISPPALPTIPMHPSLPHTNNDALEPPSPVFVQMDAVPVLGPVDNCPRVNFWRPPGSCGITL